MLALLVAGSAVSGLSDSSDFVYSVCTDLDKVCEAPREGRPPRCPVIPYPEIPLSVIPQCPKACGACSTICHDKKPECVDWAKK